MLKNFKLVNTEGLKGLMYQGRLIPFDSIDDTRAEQLIGKTHVLERMAAAPATTSEAPALPEATSDKKKAE